MIYLTPLTGSFRSDLLWFREMDKTEIIATVFDTMEEHLAIWRPPQSFDAPNETLLGIGSVAAVMRAFAWRQVRVTCLTSASQCSTRSWGVPRPHTRELGTDPPGPHRLSRL